MNDLRFNNELGEDYDLFSIALPHQDTIQKSSVSILKRQLVDKKSAKILEIGFGTGITTREILSSLKDINLVSIDNEPKMLPQAKERLVNEKLDSSCLYLSDAKEFLQKQKDNTFDGIISVWVIHNFFKKEQKEIFKEIFRVLKPGGVFVNGDKIVRDDLVQYNEDFDWQIKQFELFKKINREDLTVSWKEHYEEDANQKRKITEGEYKKTLSGIGFSKVSFSDRNYLDVIGVAIK